MRFINKVFMSEEKGLKIWTVIKWILYAASIGFLVLQATLYLGGMRDCKNFGGSLELLACESSQLFMSSFFGALNITFRTAPIILSTIAVFLLGLVWEKRRASHSEENKKML